jgi:four helix bundle protein
LRSVAFGHSRLSAKGIGPGSDINYMEVEFRFPFEKLEVWQLAIELAHNILSKLALVSENKHIRLVSQMEAAAASVAQNIAEGKGRQHKKEFIQFLYVAEGSLFEVLTLTELFSRRGIIEPTDAAYIRQQAELIDRKLHGLINSIRKKRNGLCLKGR